MCLIRVSLILSGSINYLKNIFIKILFGCCLSLSIFLAIEGKK